MSYSSFRPVFLSEGGPESFQETKNILSTPVKSKKHQRALQRPHKCSGICLPADLKCHNAWPGTLQRRAGTFQETFDLCPGLLRSGTNICIRWSQFPQLAPHLQRPEVFPARGFLHRRGCGAITATCPRVWIQCWMV